jgi:hypothetical protein
VQEHVLDSQTGDPGQSADAPVIATRAIRKFLKCIFPIYGILMIKTWVNIAQFQQLEIIIAIFEMEIFQGRVVEDAFL